MAGAAGKGASAWLFGSASLRTGLRALLSVAALTWFSVASAHAQGSLDNTAQPPPATNNSQDNTQQNLPNAQRLPGNSETAPMTGAKPASVAGQGTENLRAWRASR